MDVCVSVAQLISAAESKRQTHPPATCSDEDRVMIGSQNGLKNVYLPASLCILDFERQAVCCFTPRNTFLFEFVLDARLALISPLETVQIVPGGAQSSIKQK